MNWDTPVGRASLQAVSACQSGVSSRCRNSCFRIDFNFQPDNAVYSLIAGDVLLPWQRQTLAHSRVVHMTIDPSVPYNDPTPVTDEGEDTTRNTDAKDSGNGDAEGESGGDSSDPDRIITNSRPAQPEDGLLSDDELVALFARPEGRRPVSAYDSGMLALRARESTTDNVDALVFGGRVQIPRGRRGAHEPVWTSYTYVSSRIPFFRVPHTHVIWVSLTHWCGSFVGLRYSIGRPCWVSDPRADDPCPRGAMLIPGARRLHLRARYARDSGIDCCAREATYDRHVGAGASPEGGLRQ